MNVNIALFDWRKPYNWSTPFIFVDLIVFECEYTSVSGVLQLYFNKLLTP